MREIKFRAWDKDNQEFIENGNTLDLYYSARCNCFMFDNDFIYIQINIEFLQFTGLLDKNGKEIYEGDIVEFTPKQYETVVISGNDYVPMRKYVGWSNDQGCWAWFTMERELQSAGYTFCKNNCEKICEIIGNIYENKELLK